MPDYYLRDLILQDASYLREKMGDNLPPAARNARGKVTLKALRNYLRNLKASPLFAAFVWKKEAELVPDEEPEASAAKMTQEEEEEILALVFMSQNSLRSGFWQIEFFLDPDCAPEALHSKELLDHILRKSGQSAEVKAVNLHVPEDYHSLISAVEALPFPLNYERYPQGSTLRDREERWVRLYTLNKTSKWPYTRVFVPTPEGLWAVYGNEEYITGLDWLDYEAPVEDIQLKELCMADGYADAYGVLKDRAACEAIKTPPENRHVPEPLREAARQLAAYAKGERKKFELPLLLTEGTRFQRRVWQEISEIPYGSVRSYEDIGIRLADGDVEAGRNMTRAVGSACAANPLAVFIPCHRVIAKDGKLQGYAFGVERKNWLLSLEVLGAKE